MLPPLVPGNDDEAVRLGSSFIPFPSTSAPLSAELSLCPWRAVAGEGGRLRLWGGAEGRGEGRAGRVGVQAHETLGVGDGGAGGERALHRRLSRDSCSQTRQKLARLTRGPSGRVRLSRTSSWRLGRRSSSRWRSRCPGTCRSATPPSRARAGAGATRRRWSGGPGTRSRSWRRRRCRSGTPGRDARSGCGRRAGGYRCGPGAARPRREQSSPVALTCKLLQCFAFNAVCSRAGAGIRDAACRVDDDADSSSTSHQLVALNIGAAAAAESPRRRRCLLRPSTTVRV